MQHHLAHEDTVILLLSEHSHDILLSLYAKGERLHFPSLDPPCGTHSIQLEYRRLMRTDLLRQVGFRVPWSELLADMVLALLGALGVNDAAKVPDGICILVNMRRCL
jgi:hypothetical protein